jgi:MFS family permease
MTLRREAASKGSDRPRGGLFRSLRHSVNLRIYLSGHAVSVVGTWMQRVAQDWLILEMTHNGAALGLSVAAQFAPMLLFGPYGGLLVDRFDRRRILVVTQAIASSVHNAGRLVGPAVAGVLIATVGVGVAFIVNAASFVAVLISLALLKADRLRPSPRIGRKKGQLLEGARYLWSSPQLRTTIILVAVVAIFGQNFRVVLPLAATELYHGDAATYGWLTSAIGLGALIGAVVSASVHIPTAWSLVLTAAAFGAANLLAAVSPTMAMALIVMVSVGITNIIFNTLARTVLLLNSEPEMHGRIMAIHGQVFLGSTPLGGPLVGWLCEVFGARAGFFIAGGTAVLAAVLLARAAYRSRHSAALRD